LEIVLGYGVVDRMGWDREAGEYKIY
jgi:hypothetical protein